MRSILSSLREKNMKWKVDLLSSYFKKGETILDFGCGDLTFANELKKKNKDLDIIGVDIIEFPDRVKNIKFIKYDGYTLPFKDKSFDTVVSIYVFHHCEDAIASFKECARVAKNRVFFVESVYRHPLELPFMKIIDWFYNKIKPESVFLSYQFFSYDDWVRAFAKNDLKMGSFKKIKQIFLPSFLPIGISYIFEVIK